MKTNILRYVAVALGLGVAAMMAGQSVSADWNTYRAPSKWSQFDPSRYTVAKSNAFRTVGDTGFNSVGREIPAIDSAVPLPAPMPEPAPGVQAPYTSLGSGYAPSASPYVDAAQTPCGPVPDAPCGPPPCVSCQPPGLYPWFGGLDVLYMTLGKNSDRLLLVDDADAYQRLKTSSVRPGGSTGFDAHIGRYFGCGSWGLDVGYFFFDPSNQQRTLTPASPGDYRAAMPAWNSISFDPSGGVNPAGVANGGVDTVYNYADAASAYRVSRDVRFQGIELNLVGFGLMGTRRIGTPGCCGPGCCNAISPKCAAFASPTGPIARPCCGRVQVIGSHGFRWFQFEDELELAHNIDGAGGYGIDDLYYNVRTRNNLYGYQFGGRLDYCVTCRCNIGVGGKIGLYGNQAEYRQRAGTLTNVAYPNGASGDALDICASDTFFSTLGEFDAGIGYRFCPAWSIRGGYRLLTACGVVTAPGSIGNEYTSWDSAAAFSADDCIVLHGGYLGLEFNW